MYKRLRKKKIAGMIVTFVIFLLVGIGVFWFNSETRDYLLTGADLNSLYVHELEDGKIVRGRIQAIIGAFASDNSGSFYIIPVGENEYMGLYLPDQYEEQAIQIANDTYDYLDGLREDLTHNDLRTSGIIYKMSEQEQEYFYEWFTEDGYTLEEVKQFAVPYTYEVIPFKDWNTSRDIWCYIISGLCLLFSFYILIYILAKWDLADVKKTIREGGLTEELVESDIMSGLDMNNVLIGRKYMLACVVWKWKLYALRDVIWAYQHTQTTEHRLYGIIKTGTTVTYSVHYVCRDGKQGGISVKSQAEAQNILEYLNQTQPHMILGYSDQIRALAQSNMAELIRYSEEKAMEVERKEQQGYYDGTTQEEDDWQNDMPSLKYPH